ncbi:hypothetical protein EH183_07925 [Streptomyces sp. CB01881]|nr:hypothetical protein C2142_07915 [Streptomyces sp. CB01881]TYC77377.1 hypothetical protein EH183_07925 [Streptomyces sp. CB01881]
MVVGDPVPQRGRPPTAATPDVGGPVLGDDDGGTGAAVSEQVLPARAHRLGEASAADRAVEVDPGRGNRGERAALGAELLGGRVRRPPGQGERLLRVDHPTRPGGRGRGGGRGGGRGRGGGGGRAPGRGRGGRGR